MGHQIIMLVMALVVAAAMGVTLLWFFRRLRMIESDRAGLKK